MRLIPPLLVLLVVTGVMVVSVAVLRRERVRRLGGYRALTRICISAFAVLYALITAEVLLFLFFTESNGAGDTLASRRWLEKYWKPVNAFGYRDRELDRSELAGKKVVWVVGDSHAAGWGIKAAKDRFSNLLEEKLGTDWRVISISKPGWDTRRECEAAVAFPFRPDVVVHTYCLNDADRAAIEEGLSFLRLDDLAPGCVAELVEHSYLANLIYWRWRSRSGREAADRYWDHIRECYASERVWDVHRRDLIALLDVFRRDGASVITVIIPNLRDVDSSRPMTAQVAGFFEEQGVSTIDLASVLAGRNPEELVVNRFDPHANEGVHRLIAELVSERLSRMQLERSASRDRTESALAAP
jgi:hypothetical protein